MCPKPSECPNSCVVVNLILIPKGNGWLKAQTEYKIVFTQKQSLENALKSPRVYPYNDSLWVENHTGIEKLNASFVDKKIPIKYIDEIARFGRVHAIALEDQKWVGSADPDWEGTTEYFPANED